MALQNHRTFPNGGEPDPLATQRKKYYERIKNFNICPDCKAGRIMRTVIFHTQDMPNKSRKNALLLMSWKSRRNQRTPIVSPVIFDRGAWKNFSGMELDLNNFVFLGWAEMPEGVP